MTTKYGATVNHEDMAVTVEWSGDTTEPDKIMIKGKGLNTVRIRSIPFAAVIDAARVLARASQTDSKNSLELDLLIEKAKAKGLPPGKERLALVAAMYQRACERGYTNPGNVIMESLDVTSRETVKTWLSKARHAGFLTSVGHGQVGGEITSKGLDVLRKLAR